MKIEEISSKFKVKNPTFDDVAEIVADDNFIIAAKTGFDYAKNENYINFDNAPFCIDLATRSKTKLVVADRLKILIEDMHKKAVQQSDTPKIDGDYYEASFCLVGRDNGGVIEIQDGFWDDQGYIPNKKGDPDNYSYDFWRFDDNVTIASSKFNNLIMKSCETASKDLSLVLIHGHTHPQKREYGKINNYASRSDIVASVEESVDYYDQENGKCMFLNAIINADGDLNVFGYDVKKEKFLIFDKISYASGSKIKAYSDGNYPISNKVFEKGSE